MDNNREVKYPFEEFKNHFFAIEGIRVAEKEAFYKVNREYPSGFTIQDYLARTLEYMMTVIDEEEEALNKTCYYVEIMWHIIDKFSVYDQKDYAIMGSKASGSAVSLHLLQAVHKTVLELHDFNEEEDFDVEEIMKLADDFIEDSGESD